LSHNAQTIVTGKVTDVFGHRFVVMTATGKVLANLGSKVAADVLISEGDQVELLGKMRRLTELKVSQIAANGGHFIIVEPKKQHPSHYVEADSKPAIETVNVGGFTMVGFPRRKSKHFEILGRDKAGLLLELHLELDGALRKAKRVASTDRKWAVDLAEPDGLVAHI
jgi:hypothetical protein